jgi:molybdate transport system substrate-binding protein
MKRRVFHHLITALSASAVLPSGAQTQAPAAPLRVAAASDLKFALTALAQAFERDTHGKGPRLELQFGSSGNFAQQIKQGLPVDLFMSADESYVFSLADAGLTADRGQVYATGRIALLLPKASTLQLPTPTPAMTDAALRSQLAEQLSNVRKFAIANPEHAPYGRAAREALQNLGLWDQLSPKLVLGDNISQTTQFVTSGAAQAGVTALSLALAPEIASLSRHWLIPAALHAPLRQRMVLLKSAQPGAKALLDYLQSPPAREILAKYGFTA